MSRLIQTARIRSFSGWLALAASLSACGLDILKQSGGTVNVDSNTMKSSGRPALQPAKTPVETSAGNQQAQPASSADAMSVPADEIQYLYSNAANSRQRKNISQLKDAFASCVGTETLIIRPEMMLVDINSPNQTLTDGRVRFLLPTIYQSRVGENILDVEKEFLEVGADRTGVAPDSLEDELYLKALINAANVAAFNCDVKNTNSKCYCSGRAEAELMINRCLPMFAPSLPQYKQALDAFSSADNCGVQPASATDLTYLEKRRIAIASLLSSYSFATAK